MFSRFLKAVFVVSGIGYGINKLKESHDINKKNVYLLGDGFLARGFNSKIDYTKYNVIQIFKDPFINPQDIIHNNDCIHIKDFFMSKKNTLITDTIEQLTIDEKNAIIKLKKNKINVDLEKEIIVLGLGSKKTLQEWKEQIHMLSTLKDKNVGIIGTGPSGIEIGAMLSKNNTITYIDGLSKQSVLTYLQPFYKQYVIDTLTRNGSKFIYGTFYDKNKHVFDSVVFCTGTQPHPLTKDIIATPFLTFGNNCYVGGDCISQPFPRTAQCAYDQGRYIASRLNGETDDKFHFINKGVAIELVDNTIINGHRYIPDGIYPNFTILAYSIFFI